MRQCHNGPTSTEIQEAFLANFYLSIPVEQSGIQVALPKGAAHFITCQETKAIKEKVCCPRSNQSKTLNRSEVFSLSETM